MANSRKSTKGDQEKLKFLMYSSSLSGEITVEDKSLFRELIKGIDDSNVITDLMEISEDKGGIFMEEILAVNEAL